MEIFSYLPIQRNYIKVVLLMCCLSACQQDVPEYPILKDEAKMVKVLADMYIAESTLNKQSLTVRDSVRISYRNDIILIHDLSEKDFDTLFYLMQTDLINYKALHRKVVDRLDELVKTHDNKHKKNDGNLIKENVDNSNNNLIEKH